MRQILLITLFCVHFINSAFSDPVREGAILSTIYLVHKDSSGDVSFQTKLRLHTNLYGTELRETKFAKVYKSDKNYFVSSYAYDFEENYYNIKILEYKSKEYYKFVIVRNIDNLYAINAKYNKSKDEYDLVTGVFIKGDQKFELTQIPIIKIGNEGFE